MDKQQLIDTAVQHTDELYDKKVKPVPTPEKEIGIDLEDKIIDNIVDTVETSQFDINKLNSFTNVSSVVLLSSVNVSALSATNALSTLLVFSGLLVTYSDFNMSPKPSPVIIPLI